MTFSDKRDPNTNPLGVESLLALELSSLLTELLKIDGLLSVFVDLLREKGAARGTVGLESFVFIGSEASGL